MKVKICGIKCMKEIDIVNILKPDYIGFVFAKSRRKVDKFMVKQMIDSLSRDINTCFVFAGQEVDDILNICDFVMPDIIQLHSNEDEIFIDKIKSEMTNIEIWKAVPYNRVDFFPRNADRFLIDSTCPGSGVEFNWLLLEEIGIETQKIIIAGGLGPDNIVKLKAIYDPYCVDASSKLESNGIKDFELTKLFIDKVRGK